MKHYLIEITYRKPFGTFDDIIPHHRAFLQKGYDRGMLLCSGPQSPPTGGIVIARAESREEIETFFHNDPYALHLIGEYRIVEFAPMKHQPFLVEWIAGTPLLP